MTRRYTMLTRLTLTALLMAGTVALTLPADAKPGHAKGNPHVQNKHQAQKHQRVAPWQESSRFQARKNDNVRQDRDRKGNDRRDWSDDDRRDWDDDRRDYRNSWDDRDQDRFRDWLGSASSRRYTYNGNIPRDILRRNGLSRSEFESLPPGIQKNLLRGKALPPGQANKIGAGYRLNRYELGRVNPISDFIRDALGMPRSYYNFSDGRRVGRYGDDAILYNPNSGVVFDVLSGVFN